MQAALVTGKGRVELLEFAEPRAAPGKAVVRITLCGICGTDVHAFQSGQPYNPAICGHEWTGVVAAAGEGVSNVREGDRVVAGVAAACGTCRQCRAGFGQYCSIAFQGIVGGPGGTPHGGFAPAITVPANRLHPVPTALSDIEAALIEPLTVALHGVRRTSIRVGDTAVVLGAGPIGQLTSQLARVNGARVIVVEPDPGRAALARQLGAALVLDPASEDVPARVATETGGIGPDVVFECAGISPTINQAVELVRQGGAVTLIGLSDQPATIQPGTWLRKEPRFTASMAYLHEEFGIAMELVASGRINVAALHTATYPLDRITGGFEALATEKRPVKVLIDPRHQSG